MLSRHLLSVIVIALALALSPAAFSPTFAADKTCPVCEDAKKLADRPRCEVCKSGEGPCDKCRARSAKLAAACKTCEKGKGACAACEKLIKAQGCHLCAAKSLVAPRLFCSEACEKAAKPCEKCEEARASLDALRCPSDPGQDGPFRYASLQLFVKWKGGEKQATALCVFPNEEKGPFPAVVISPGGDAEVPNGYEAFAQRFASWGFASILVAFNDKSADERGAHFSEVLDWLEKQNADAASPLKGKIDAKKLIACGHSRGGWASVIAATTDKRFGACLALSPAAPGNLPGDKRPPLCIVTGDADPADTQSAKMLFKLFEKPKFLATVKGVPHMIHQDTKAPVAIAYATAFLTWKFKGDAHAKKFLLAESADATVQPEE